MTDVSVSMFSPIGPDLSNASAAETVAAIMKAFAARPFALDSRPSVDPLLVRPGEINDWLVAHGCRHLRLVDFVHDSFELVEVGP